MKKEIPYEDQVQVFKKVVDFCHMHLFDPNSKQVHSYLKDKRGLSDKIIQKFKLGAFPRYADVIANNVGAFSAWQCGLVGFNSDGATISKFNTHNVIIPIYDQCNNPIAIMGRTLLSKKEQELRGLPKYINSPFRKSKSLFGLNFSKDVIRNKNEIILVEGNFDVITAHQNGLENVAAISSAALSKYQVALAARYAENIALMLDNDKAGKAGTERAFKLYKDYEGINLNKVPLPNDVKDIDDFFASGNTVQDLR